MNKLDDNGIFRIGQLAVIKRGRAEADWVLIPVDEGVQCYVNGTPIKLMYHLQENDVITFDGNEDRRIVFKMPIEKPEELSSSAHRGQSCFGKSSLIILAIVILAAILLFLSI